MHKHGISRFGLLIVAIAVAATPVFAGSTWVKTRIGLRATDSEPLASGKAVYRERTQDLRRTLNVEVEDVLSATSVQVIVDGNLVGTITLLAGTGELELDTNDADTVPIIFPRSIIKIKDSADGDVLLKGRNR